MLASRRPALSDHDEAEVLLAYFNSSKKGPSWLSLRSRLRFLLAFSKQVP